MADEKRPEPTERTPKGYEVRVPERREFFGNLEKAASPDPESWARSSVRFDATTEGKTGIIWIARIEAHGQLFERREQGPVGKRDALRARAADAVVSDYLAFAERIGSTG